jgi:uncharacterized membrane protein YkvI
LGTNGDVEMREKNSWIDKHLNLVWLITMLIPIAIIYIILFLGEIINIQTLKNLAGFITWPIIYIILPLVYITANAILISSKNRSAWWNLLAWFLIGLPLILYKHTKKGAEANDTK